MTNANIDRRLAEIKKYSDDAEMILDIKYPSPCAEYENESETLRREVRDLQLEAYGAWEQSPAYAAFKAKQALNLHNRAAA